MARRGAPIDPELSRNLYVQRDCQTAEELLDLLLPHTSRLLYDRLDHHWLFRGQPDARWGLTPRAMRPGELHGIANSFLDPSDMGECQQLEEQLVLQFSSILSDRGFEAPGDRPELRDRHTKFARASPDGTRFPAVPVRWLFALAQHEGVPTRLLDWTRNALVAAYFAAVTAARNVVPDDERLAVWALSEDYLHGLGRRGSPRVTIVTAPTVSNPNLLAQQGVFTLVEFLSRRPKSKG